MTSPSPLTDLGFTETEAAVYGALLKSGPNTGYKLAGEVGKAAPNVYQALDSLSRKSAVVMGEGGDTRIFRAVPVGELLSGLERRFQRRKAEALKVLKPLEEPSRDHRLYALNSVAQVYAKAEAMIAGARETLLFDLFPEPLAALLAPLEAAAARGVTVSGVTYGKAPPTSFRCCAHDHGLWERWPGQQVTVVADGAQSLVALIGCEGDGIEQAVWTDSPFLACLQHTGLAAEIHVAGLPRPLGEPIASLGLLSSRPPGLRELLGEDPP